MLVGQHIGHDGWKEIVPKIFRVEPYHAQDDAVVVNTRGNEVRNAIVVWVVFAAVPTSVKSKRHLVAFHAQLVDQFAGFHGHPASGVRQGIRNLLMCRGIRFVPVPRAPDQLVVFLAIKQGIEKFRVIGQNSIKFCFDVRSIATTRVFLADRRKHLPGFMPRLFLRDSQNGREVALDGRLDGLVALNLVQVPYAERHKGSGGKDNGQLQSEQQPCAVGEPLLLLRRNCAHIGFGWSQALSVERNYTGLKGGCVKRTQTIVKSCKKALRIGLTYSLSIIYAGLRLAGVNRRFSLRSWFSLWV
jgi:hypothetical protein